LLQTLPLFDLHENLNLIILLCVPKVNRQKLCVNIYMIHDDTMWLECDPEMLWIYDKLILSRKLGYTCGPSGVPVPEADLYIVRPITNIEGMGRDAKIIWINEDTDTIVPPGHFWCEVFEGRHLSVDYLNGEQVLCVEGYRFEEDPLYRWSEWKKVDDQIPFPKLLSSFNVEQINCEFIGGKLIEVHLRHNPDFDDREYNVIYPVWDDQKTKAPLGLKFIEDKDFKRKGFFVPES